MPTAQATRWKRCCIARAPITQLSRVTVGTTRQTVMMAAIDGVDVVNVCSPTSEAVDPEVHL